MSKKRNTSGRRQGAQAIPPTCAAGPSLLEFWHALQREQHGGSAPSGAAASSEAARSSGAMLSSARYGSGSRRGSGSSGGSCGLGYGLGLILPDLKAQKRVMDIMRELCEKDAARARRKKAE